MEDLIKKIFDEMDVSKNGEIDWLELKGFMIKLSERLKIPMPTPTDIDRFINEYSDGKTKTLNLEQMTPFIKKVIKLMAGELDPMSISIGQGLSYG